MEFGGSEYAAKKSRSVTTTGVRIHLKNDKVLRIPQNINDE